MPLPSEEVIVRVTALLSELQAGMAQAVEVVAQANAQMVGAGASADEEMKASAQTTSEAVGAAYVQTAETASAAWTAATEQMSTASVEAAAQVDAAQRSVTASVGRSQAAIVAEATAFNTAVQAKQAALLRLDTAMGGNLASAEGMAEAEYALDNAMAAGAITAQEEAVYMERLAAAEEAVTVSTVEATVAQDAFTMSSRASAEVGTILSEALAGNFGRIRRSAAALANQTGILSKALSILLSPAGLVTIAIGGMGAMAYEQENQIDKLRLALTSTGDAAGISASQMDEWASRVGSQVGTIGHAQDIYAQLAQTGRLTGEELHAAGDAAVYMAAATDMGTKEAATAVMRMVTEPQTAIMRLNDQYHFLNASVRDQVQAMLDAGDTVDATRLAVNALSKRMHDASEQARVDTPFWNGWGDAVANAFHNIGVQLDLAAGGGTLQERIAAASAGAGKQVNAIEIARLQAQLAEQNKKAQAAGLLNTMQSNEAPGGFGQRALEWDVSHMRKAEAEMQLSYQERIKYEQAFWKRLLDTATKGSAEYIAAYEHLQGFGQKTPAVHHKKVHKNHDQLPGLDPYAKQQMEQEYRAMQEAARQSERIQSIDQQSFFQHEQAKTQIAEDAINQREALGQISATQAIAARERLEEQLYRAEYGEYMRELKLAQGKPAMIAKINAEILALQDQHEKRMSQLQDHAALENQKRWHKYLQPAANAMHTSIAGMIQGTQTMSQAAQGVLRSILASYIDTGIQMVTDWTAREAAKTGILTSSEAARTSIKAANRAADTAQDTAMSVASVIRASGVAGAKGTASFAGAPWPIDMGAPAFGAGMAALAASYSSVASAAGGWERVPMDGAMTMLHKDEQVLPSTYAEGLRKLVAGGGNGQTVHHHYHANVNAMDARSLNDFLRRNPGALKSWAMHAQRNGY